MLNIFNKSKKILLFILTCAVIIFSIFVLFGRIDKQKKIKEVQVAEVKQGRIEETVEASGIISSSRMEDIKAKGNGIANLISVKEGQKVKSGQILGIIKNQDLNDLSSNDSEIDKLLLKGDFDALLPYFYKAYIKEAEALESSRVNYLLAKEKYEQSKLLYDKGAIPKQQLVSAEIEHKKMEFLYHSAEKEFKNMLQSYKISAPCSGTIVEKSITEETEVKTGDVLFRVADMEQVIAKLQVDELDVRKVKEGQETSIIGDTFSPHILGGYVDKISASLDRSSMYRGVEVLCRIVPPKEIKLKIGASVTAEIKVSQKENAIFVPTDAVLIKDDEEIVFIVKDNQAKLKKIKTGISNKNFVEIIEGLNIGEKIVTVGNVTLKDGETIRIR